MTFTFMNKEIDIEKLFAAVWKVISYDTVDEIISFADLIRKAADLAIQAGERMSAEDDGQSRDLDDPVGENLWQIVNYPKMGYALHKKTSLWASDLVGSRNGVEATIHLPRGSLRIQSSLVGEFNIYNVMAAIGVALALEVPEVSICRGIEALSCVPGRMERIENEKGLEIFVDYAHTDDALKNLLETARELSPKRIILLFGAGGDRDKTKRARMGEVAGNLSDLTILTSDNPRSEDPLAIISDIEKGIKKTGTKNYEIVPDRKEAIEHALSVGEKGDYILVAGKGHEDYQVLKDKTIPFKDADVIRSILEKKESS